MSATSFVQNVAADRLKARRHWDWRMRDKPSARASRAAPSALQAECRTRSPYVQRERAAGVYGAFPLVA